MKKINWNCDKNTILKQTRDTSFEDVIFCLENGKILDKLDHPNQQKYPNQKLFVVEINEYTYLVPFVETEDEIFLKTIIPNRQATRKYLVGGKNER
jgi:hypothetical protein